MMVAAGALNYTDNIYITQDASASNPGEPIVGLLFSDIETGGSASYMRQGDVRTDFTLVTQTPGGAHTDGGFVEVDATNMPGVYRIDIPDGAFVTGADFVIIQVVVESTNNAVSSPLKIEIIEMDLRDAVRGGLSSLPNAAAEAAGGLFTRGPGPGQIQQQVDGQVDVNAERLNNGAQSLLDLKDFADAGYDPGTNKVQGVVLVDTTTANSDMRGTDSAFLAVVGGALADAAAADDPTSADTLMAYAKQLVNVLVGSDGIAAFPTEQAPANAINLAEVIRAIHADVTGLAGAAMRGTNNAALASVIGALADAAAAGDPTASDTLMAYAKQIINTLEGSDGMPTFPAEQPPGSNISLAEVIRAMAADVTGLAGDPMRGTNSAALASVATEARLAELDAGNLPSDVDDILEDTAVIGALGAGLTAVTDRLPAALTKGTADSGSTTTMVDSVRSEGDPDYWKGMWIRFTSGNITGQTRYITGFDTGANRITFTPATTQAVATQDYEILPAGAVDIAQWLATTPNALVSGRVDADVGNMQNGVIGALAFAAGAIDAAALNITAVNEIRDAILSDSIPFAGANIDQAISGNATPAEVLTQINAALDAAINELSQTAPAASPSLRNAVMLLYMALRNKLDVDTSGADELQIHNNANVVIAKKAITDAAGDYSEAQMVSGP